ncbi:fumarate reductase subunit C [Phytoactinopolyspora endophytica]|uniref:fumarate reductase subunit C n=1 Tax=Phytoactinopolyspora endophytica TaxID=1642495 RepID=UPI00101DDC31
MSLWWWARKRSYTLFILRELSSVFVAWFVLFTLLTVWSVARGEERYEQFLDFASNPLVVALNVLALAFLLFHTVTWFNLTPKAMPVKVRGRRVPSTVVIAAQWLGFVVVSAFVVWLVVS